MPLPTVLRIVAAILAVKAVLIGAVYWRRAELIGHPVNGWTVVLTVLLVVVVIAVVLALLLSPSRRECACLYTTRRGFLGICARSRDRQQGCGFRVDHDPGVDLDDPQKTLRNSRSEP